MSSSQHSDESVSTALLNSGDLVEKLSFGIVEVLVKGRICWMVHLFVFTIPKQNFMTDKVRWKSIWLLLKYHYNYFIIIQM